jgi:hypothetical protein
MSESHPHVPSVEMEATMLGPPVDVEVSTKSSWKHIWRLSFRRGVKNCYVAGGRGCCEVIVCSEFSDQLICLECSLTLSVWYCGDQIDQCRFECTNTIELSEKSTSSRRLNWTVPLKEGYYFLSIVASVADPQCIILPLQSDKFHVRRGNTHSMAIAAPMLTNRRRLTFNKVSIDIKEEYGSVIGGHIYDSAIVTILYLLSCNANVDRNSCILELGSGCGLTGIWCAKEYGCRCLLTDLPSQLLLLSENCLANDVDKQCNCVAFDWGMDVTLFEEKHSVSNLSLIIAADVLYDPDAAVLLLKVLLQLKVLHKSTRIILAQKNRNHLSLDVACYDLSLMCDGLEFRCVYHEADVIVWNISLS